MEGKISLFEQTDKSGKRPHFKGYLTIDGQDHEYALWPAKSGNGFSGQYRPKGVRPTQERVIEPETRQQIDALKESVKPSFDDEIPY